MYLSTKMTAGAARLRVGKKISLPILVLDRLEASSNYLIYYIIKSILVLVSGALFEKI